MINLKKASLAILMSGSNMLFAGTMGSACVPGNVTTPCLQSGWEVYAHALYLQPTISNTNNMFFYNSLQTGSSTNIQTTWQNFDPSWGWGFDVAGAYHFGMGKDINFNWSRVHNKSTVTQPVSSETTFMLPIVSDVSSVNPQWDIANAELGQRVNIDDTSVLRLHAGVQYARINTDFDATYSDGSLLSRATANYNGFGPRLGADLYYGLEHVMDKLTGLSVYGKAASALLVGPESFHSSITVPYLGAAYMGSASGTHINIVPELEAKLGVQYTYALTQGELSVDAGWMWNTYFNAQAVAYTYNYQGSAEVYSENQSNVGLQGLYFGLKWVGNAA